MINRDKESLEGVETQGVGFLVKNDNWSIYMRHDESHNQNYYGFLGYLDFDDAGYYKFGVSTLQTTYTKELDNDNKIKVSGGILENCHEVNTYLYPLEPNNFGLYDPHSRFKYQQQDLFGQISLTNKSLEDHTFEFGINVMHHEITRNDFYTNVSDQANIGLFVPEWNMYMPITDQLTRLSRSQGFFNDPKESYDRFYYFKDYYSVTDNLDTSIEIRYNDNDHYRDRVDYKLGSIYAHDTHIYKMIYAKQYRTPSSIESNLAGHWTVYGNEDLESESVENFELIYLHKQPNDTFSIGGYYTLYRDSIDYKLDDSRFVFNNTEENQENYGIELEYSKRFDNKSMLLLNSSYSEYLYKNKLAYLDEINTPTASRFTSNLGYIYPLNFRTNLGTLIKYYGKKRVPLNEKAEIGSTYLVDMTLDYRLSDQLQLFLSGKNLLDRDYYYYGYNTRDNKMLREGRMWLLNLKYDF